jgi:hypothetical protein
MADYSTDLLTGGTPTVDTDAGAGYQAAQACDNNAATYWQSANSAYPHWFKYDLGAGRLWCVLKLTISARNSGTGLNVKNFTLQGSNNDSTWTVVYTGIMANSTGVQTFNFYNSNRFRYWKVNVTDNYSTGHPNIVQIFEIEMMGVPAKGGFSGCSPWIFLKDMWEKHDRLWIPKLSEGFSI